MITRSLDRHSRDHRQCATAWQTNTTFPQTVTPLRGARVSTIARRRESSTINRDGTPGQRSETATRSSGVVSLVYLLVLAGVIGWATWAAATRTVSGISSCTMFDVMQMFGGIP